MRLVLREKKILVWGDDAFLYPECSVVVWHRTRAVSLMFMICFVVLFRSPVKGSGDVLSRLDVDRTPGKVGMRDL